MSEATKEEERKLSRAHHITKGVPGVRHLKRRLTDPGISLIGVEARKVKRQRTKLKNDATSKEVGDESKTENTEETEENSNLEFKACRLTPKDNIGKDYLLDMKPQESLTKPSQKNRILTKSQTSVKILAEEKLAFDADFKLVIEQERKRQLIIAEMMQTEKTYLEFIQTLVMLFIVPLRKSLEKDPVPLLTQEQIEIIFQNIEEITIVNGVIYIFQPKFCAKFTCIQNPKFVNKKVEFHEFPLINCD